MSGDTFAKIGSLAFILGVVIAIVSGLIQLDGQTKAMVTSLLIVLGLIVGFLNVTGKETTPYLIAAVSLVLVSDAGRASMEAIQVIGPYLAGLFGAVMSFVIPAIIVVSLKAIYALASEE